MKGIGVQLHLAKSKTVSSDGTDGEWLVRLMNTLLVANWLSGQCKLFVPYSNIDIWVPFQVVFQLLHKRAILELIKVPHIALYSFFHSRTLITSCDIRHGILYWLWVANICMMWPESCHEFNLSCMRLYIRCYRDYFTSVQLAILVTHYIFLKVLWLGHNESGC